MAGVISLLEGEAADRVERLWDAMQHEFGVPRGFPGAIPHISYHLGDCPAEPPVTTKLATLAGGYAPFAARVSGLGIFGGAAPVVYLAVARGPRLAALHLEVLGLMRELGFENNQYYEPETWLPHITIAQQNVGALVFAEVAEWLAGQVIQFGFEVTNLALASETPEALEVLASFPFGRG